jgi:hypothetical protein
MVFLSELSRITTADARAFASLRRSNAKMGIKCAEKAGERCFRRLIARVHLPIPIRCWDHHDGLVVALRQTPPQVSLPPKTQEVHPASNLASH